MKLHCYCFKHMAISKFCWSTLAVLLTLALLSNTGTGTEARPSKSEKSGNSFVENYDYDSDIDDSSASSVSSESIENPKSKTDSENTQEIGNDLNSANTENDDEDEDADLSTITIKIKLHKSKPAHNRKTHRHQSQKHSYTVNLPNSTKNHKSNSSKENFLEKDEEEKYLQAVREYFSKFDSSDKSILSAPVSGQDLQCGTGQEWSELFGQCIRLQSSTTRRTARGRRKQRGVY